MELPVVFNNRYQLIKKIGEGGLAEVYQAQDMALGRMVAVKALRSQYTRDPNFLVNFHREAQSVARLSDTFIVAVYDFGQDKNRPYIVFEWVPGSDMRSLLDKHGAIGVEQTVEYGIQICSAVGAAHRAGLVHGDLKPGNILITPNNVAKVTDFGLAKALGASAMDDGEVVWGTPAYFAPEQAAGARVLPATDVYAIGIILYEMLTGNVPFRSTDDQEVARKQLYEAHVPVDQINAKIPEALARIVDAAMAKNPNERFLTADHLREALLAFKQGRLGMGGHYAPISSVVGSPLQAAVIPPPPPPPSSDYIAASQIGGRTRHHANEGNSGPRVDLMLMVLGIVAVIAVLGLGLLFIALYTVYAQGAYVPNSSLQVKVPDVVGLDDEVARSNLEAVGLSMTINGQAPHPSWPISTVIEQSAPPGEIVPRGGDVKVILSQGPAVLKLPNLVGMSADEAQTLLASLALVPQKYEDWSVETPGLVIRQDPAAGTEVEDHTLITLVVSSGSRVPIGANFGQQILLNAYEIPRNQYKVGESIKLTFFWNLVRQPSENYTLYIHLTTPQGGIVSKIEQPTHDWQMGQVIVEPQELPIPVTTAPGDYQIRVTFYNTEAKRLAIADVGRGEADNVGALILRSIQIIP